MSEEIVETPAPTIEHTVELVSDKTRVELTTTQIGALMAPLNSGRVKNRTMSGQQQSYIEAWDVKASLIRIFGFGGFSAEVVESKVIDIRDNGRQGQYPPSHQKAGQDKTPYVMAQATVRLTIFGIGPTGQDAVYSETAIGTNDGWTIGDVADNAIKSAASDALKRCAIYLGTQFGLSLYNNGSREDVVRVLLEPEQKAMLDAYRSQGEPPPPAIDHLAAAEENLNRALGAKRIEESLDKAADQADVVADNSGVQS